MYHGDIRLGATIDVKFCTCGTTGAPTQLAGTGTVVAYPANSTTEVTGGITTTIDFDGRTGLNNVRIVASAGNGYTSAENYCLVISQGTVGGVSAVGYVVGSFSIENRSALMPATGGRTLVVDAAGLADANTVKLGPSGSGTAQTARDVGASVLLSSGTGTGQVKLSGGYVAPNWGDVGNPTTTVGLANTTVKTATDVETDTADIQSRLPAALTANGNMKADALRIGGTTQTGTDLGAINVTNLNTLSGHDPGEAIMGATDLGTGAGLTSLASAADLATVDTVADAIKAKTDNLPTDPADESLVIAATDAIAALIGTPAGASLSVDVAAVKSDTAAILVDTGTTLDGRLPAALVGGRMDASVGAMAANTLTASALAADAVDEILDETVGDGTITMRQALRILIAGMAGKLDGAATTTVTIRNLADSADVIVATVDADGNRSAVTVTP